MGKTIKHKLYECGIYTDDQGRYLVANNLNVTDAVQLIKKDLTQEIKDLIGDYFGGCVAKEHIPAIVKAWCITFESELKQKINGLKEKKK